MKLTILGTGNATVSECYNTCYAISDEGKHFLVDAGGGNRILKVLKDKMCIRDSGRATCYIRVCVISGCYEQVFSAQLLRA